VVEANLVGDEGRQIDHGWMMVHSVGVGKLVSRQGLSPNVATISTRWGMVSS